MSSKSGKILPDTPFFRSIPIPHARVYAVHSCSHRFRAVHPLLQSTPPMPSRSWPDCHYASDRPDTGTGAYPRVPGFYRRRGVLPQPFSHSQLRNPLPAQRQGLKQALLQNSAAKMLPHRWPAQALPFSPVPPDAECSVSHPDEPESFPAPSVPSPSAPVLPSALSDD